MATVTKFSKVAVALSGGIDSAVAAILLKNKGYDVIGTFIKYWNIDDPDAKPMLQDLENTRRFCHSLKIPLQEVDFTNEFLRKAYSHIIADYNVGYIPCVDAICNEQILFGSYHQYCTDKLNVDAVATGHYAKSSFGPFLEHYTSEKFSCLMRSADTVADQSGVLSRIAQETLKRTMFPLGERTKTEVEKIACQHSLNELLQRGESSGSCLINPEILKSFRSRHILDNPGRFLHVDTGEIVGEHRGLHHWPIGSCYSSNFFVVGNDEKNIIFVASSRDHPAFYCRSLTLSYCHWIKNKSPGKFFRGTFQCSNNRTLLNGNFVDLLDYPEGGYVFVELETPLYAATPGQYVVLYDGDECLGSMKIMNTGPSDVFYQNDVDLSKNKLRDGLLGNLVARK